MRMAATGRPWLGVGGGPGRPARAGAPMPPACLHCLRVAPEVPLGLCLACARRPGVRHTYTRRARWTAELESRLRALAERAGRRAELFGRPGAGR